MVSMAAATLSATATSLAPFARTTLTPTTGAPLKRAKVRGSAIESVMSPRSSSCTSPPVGSAILVAAKLAADIERGQSDALQPDRIKSNADLALDVADTFDGADAADSLQLAD